MMEDSSRTAQASESAESPDQLTCDFCHKVVPSVQRVALDHDYERLRTPHAVMYACPSCSEEKERSRVGAGR